MAAYAENRKALFDYQIIETFEAGIELKGFEVKAIKSGRINIAGCFAVPRENEVWLLNADIPPYQPNNTPADYDPKRSRRLLLKLEEIKYLLGKIHSANLTLVPLRVYNKRGLIKVELGLGKPKKKADKREAIKKRESKREISRTLKG
ncbi:MAG TPA: SsrA-binding protein SmpB [Candidatus Paceibacterota bacterium]